MLGVIATIPVPFAAVQPWVWPVYALMMIIAFAFSYTADQSIKSTGGRLQKSALAVFFIWTLFLCIPLPPTLLSILSPVRSELLANSLKLTGNTANLLALGYSSRAALTWWTFLLSLLLFFLATRKCCANQKNLKRIVGVVIAVGLVESLYGMTQALVPSMGVLWVDYIQEYMGTARGTFINRNNFAGFIEMIWPLALGATFSLTGRVRSIKMTLHSDRLNRQALMALCTTVFLLTLILTRSRAGIISGMAGLVAFLTLARPALHYRSRQIRIMLVGSFLLLVIYASVIGIGPVVERFFSLGNDSGSRISIWRDSLGILNNHPLGIGLRNYENVFAVYNHSELMDKKVIQTHNDYLQLLIETGWVGFISLMLAIVVFLVKCLRRIKTLDCYRAPFRFYMAVGSFSGIASIGIHSLFDFNLQIPANCVYVVVLMAILSVCTHPLRTND